MDRLINEWSQIWTIKGYGKNVNLRGRVKEASVTDGMQRNVKGKREHCVASRQNAENLFDKK